jgi:lipid-A-disaccharide synthase
LRAGQAASVLVVAGEASADAHGAKVIRSLRERIPSVQSFGLGGGQMEQAGLERVADPGALNVVGISEAIRGLGKIRRVFKTLVAETRKRKPSVALLMDLPDFNLRLAKQLKRIGVPVVYYLAPQAWAWRKGRVRQIRRRVDRLCVVFPFEESFFSAHGVPVEFVGHPLKEEISVPLESDAKRIVLLPGSRPREIQRLLEPLARAALLLQRENPELTIELPLAPGLDKNHIESELDRIGLVARVREESAFEVLHGARLALAASGTVTLEAALAGVPMVVVYKVSRLTYCLVRPFFQLPFVCIVNILAGRMLVPELLQGRVQAESIFREAVALMSDDPRREEVVAGFRKISQDLGGKQPSVRVAEILSGYIGERNA